MGKSRVSFLDSWDIMLKSTRRQNVMMSDYGKSKGIKMESRKLQSWIYKVVGIFDINVEVLACSFLCHFLLFSGRR